MENPRLKEMPAEEVTWHCVARKRTSSRIRLETHVRVRPLINRKEQTPCSMASSY
jgi:hypothetical protein